MAYTLKTHRTDFKGGKNILASTHFQYVEAGVTLDAEAFGKGYIEVGTAIGRNKTTGKYEPYEDDNGQLNDKFDELGILNIDVDCDGENDIIVGEVLIRASVYEAKLPDNVTEAFKEATRPMIRYVNEK